MKFKLLTLMILLAAMLLVACTGRADSAVDISAVNEKLDAIDAYKAELPDTQAVNQDYDPAEGTFRSFNFGMSMEMIGALETLPLNTQNSNSLIYSGAGIFGFDTQLAYWFNSNNQLFAISYSLQNDSFSDTIDSLMTGMSGEYGEPKESGYYDSTSNTTVTFDTEEEALKAVDSGDVYYYAAFADEMGILITLDAGKIDTGYDYYMTFTDNTYYTE